MRDTAPQGRALRWRSLFATPWWPAVAVAIALAQVLLTMRPLSSNKPAVVRASQPQLRTTSVQANCTLDLAALPDGFDWEAYRFFNPDLPGVANWTESDTQLYFLRFGRFQPGRIWKKVDMYVSWVPIGGLCNQMFAHNAGLSLARYLNASQGIVGHAFSRPNFNHAPSWKEEPLGSLFDVPRWRHYWRGHGLQLVEAANSSGCLELDMDNKRHPYRLTRNVSNWPQPQVDIAGAAAALVPFVREAARVATGANPAAEEVQCIRLDLGNPAAIADMSRSGAYTKLLAGGFFFAPAIVKLAERVLSDVAAAGHSPFLGVHLRIEGDWPWGMRRSNDRDWKVGKRKRGPLEAYADTMRAAGFKEDSPVYIASGFFSQKDGNETVVEAELHKRKVLGVLLHKGLFLKARDLAGLHSEQLALIDLLVLARAERYVGDSRSTFSIFLREYRAAVFGRPKSSFFRVLNSTYMDNLAFVPDPGLLSPGGQERNGTGNEHPH